MRALRMVAMAARAVVPTDLRRAVARNRDRGLHRQQANARDRHWKTKTEVLDNLRKVQNASDQGIDLTKAAAAVVAIWKGVACSSPSDARPIEPTSGAILRTLVAPRFHYVPEVSVGCFDSWQVMPHRLGVCVKVSVVSG